MKHILLTALLIGVAANYAGARTAEPVNPPAPLPDGVTAYPAQGFVDVSNSAYPNGISNIGLAFTQEVMPNPDNQEPAKLYYNDFTAPAEETLSTSVDMLSWTSVGVLFKGRSWNLTGEYKVEIPEGMFLFVDGETADDERTGTEPTPAVTLYYEIYRGYVINPGSGTVERIKETVLTFTDADEVVATPLAAGIEFFMDNNNDVFNYSYTITDADDDGKVNDVVFSFSTSEDGEITTPGIYGLSIPAGAFRFNVYGPDHDADAADVIEHTSNDILVKYTLPHASRPDIDPDPDYAVKSFDNFLLYLPDGLQLWFADTMGRSPLYGVDESGEVNTSKMYAYAKADPYQEGDPFVVLRLYDPQTQQMLESFTPADGLYCLRLIPSLLYGSWAPQTEGEEEFVGGSDAYDYFYTVTNDSGVVRILPEVGESAAERFYNLNGVEVKDGNASPGLYISNQGKKLIIR